MPLNNFKAAALIAALLAISTNSKTVPCEVDPEGDDCQLSNNSNPAEIMQTDGECTSQCDCNPECKQNNIKDTANSLEDDSKKTAFATSDDLYVPTDGAYCSQEA